jgi:hypothetical protein
VIPENQTWKKTEDIVCLEKNHGSGDTGYYVDVRGSQEVMDTLKRKLDGLGMVKCQWNPAGSGAGKILTVREVRQDFQGAAILQLIGKELGILGYSKMR